MPNVTALDIGFAAAGLFLLKRVLTPKPAAPLPPGPKGLPVVGNVADMPTEQEWKTFAEWGKQYGPICSITILGQPIVILNDVNYAYDMLDKKSSMYSDRPLLIMGGEMVGWSKTLALTPYGERFKSIRKLIYKLMGSKANIEKFQPLMEIENHRLMRRIFEDPERVADAIRKTAGAIILTMSHGYTIKEKDDPIVKCVDHATEQFSMATQPGAFLVDVLPALRHVPAWIPGAGFQLKAAEWRRTINQMADDPHNIVKARMAAGTDVPNFTSNNLEGREVPHDEEEIIKWAAASLYSGGADTTVSATYVFFLAMTLYPEAQAKAQAEIDAVIGNDRLPGHADRVNLPYVEALVKEVFRWQPVAPLAIPHRVTEDNIHDGYFIPKGTLVIPNIWQMLHDENTYADPMTFNPDRFMPASVTGKEPERDSRDICFGFGRRICPGLNVADTSVWLAVAMSLAVFSVTKVRDASGKEITPLPEMTNGTISHPKPFKTSIKPRTPKAEALITSVEFASSD